MFEAIIGFGYTGWGVTVLLIGAIRWVMFERDMLARHHWPHLE